MVLNRCMLSLFQTLVRMSSCTFSAIVQEHWWKAGFSERWLFNHFLPMFRKSVSNIWWVQEIVYNIINWVTWLSIHIALLKSKKKIEGIGCKLPHIWLCSVENDENCSLRRPPGTPPSVPRWTPHRRTCSSAAPLSPSYPSEVTYFLTMF